MKTVLLMGPPNSGKTTLYNWLTSSRYKTVNYPGSTVDYSIGTLAARYEAEMKIIDSPGTYSLVPKAADEEVTVDILYNQKKVDYDHIVLVVDGTQLSRHLLVAEQLKLAGFSFVIAITMSDLLRRSKLNLDTRVIEEYFSTKVIAVDGVLGSGVKELIAAVQTQSPVDKSKAKKLTEIGIEELQIKVTELVEKLMSREKTNEIYNRTAQVDKVLMHPFWGIVIFIAIMGLLFTSIFWIASPIMNFIQDSLASFTDKILALHWGLASEFLANGVVLGISAVAVFIPQIFILFVCIGLLEDSGYLARAATLIDRPFSYFGLSGRSFVPILSSFACAVPAMMAARNISSKRDRWITHFIIPLMTCSARLPVYALILAFLFKDDAAWKPGLALAGLYFGSILLGAITAAIINGFLPKDSKSYFIMELPLYRKIRWSVLFRQAFNKSLNYLYKAGPTIFVFSVLIWVGTTFPNYKEENKEVKLHTSYLSIAGQKIEPIFAPMGVDWRVGVGLMTAFAARETFVSSLAVLFNATEVKPDENAAAGPTHVEEPDEKEGLVKAMKDARNSQGNLIFTVATCSGLILFFMIALQCISTFSVAIKESNSVNFAVGQLVVYNVMAYILAVGLVHGLRAMGIT